MSHFVPFPRAAAGRPVAATPAVAGHRPLGLVLALATCFASGLAQAQPSGAQAVVGSATITQDGSRTTVTTRNGAGSNHSAINWQSFSVPAGSSTWFAQPGAGSTSINRVTGRDPSAIFGTLGSNGKLVLVNPAGIAVGAGAVVDTAGFIASTLRMSDADALAGRLRFGDDGPRGAGLQVGGRVVGRGGDVVLIAPDVDVSDGAVVQSVGGSTILAAGRKVALTGRGLEGIHLELSAPADRVRNLGTLQGDSVGLFAGQLQHSGLAVAQSAQLQGGRLVLLAQGDALVDGRLDASSAQGSGGSVDVLGRRVALHGAAQVDASGAAGGGQVRIGGDYQGGNAAVPNAARTFVGAGVTVNADARQAGPGGRVIVWSDEATRMHGQLSARGGERGGDGGFAEVSGRQWLEFTGRADLRAPQGRAGTLLLDPNDITIQAAGATNANPVPTPAPSPPPAGWSFSGPESGSGVVTVTDLQEQLQLGDVHVVTSAGSGGTGIITVADDVTWSSTSALGLAANGGIALNASLTATEGSLSLVTSAGNITQSAGVIHVAQLAALANAGSVTLNRPNRVATLAGEAAGGFSFRNDRPLTVGSVNTPFSGPVSGIRAGAGVTLSATGNASDVTLLANVSSDGGFLAIDAVRDVVVGGSGAVTLLGHQGVSLDAGGNVDFRTDSSTAITSRGGPVNITAAGAILGDAVISTAGLTPHSVTLTGVQGVNFQSIDTTASGSFSTSGGAVTITSASGGITGQSIAADGSVEDHNSASGGPVSLTASNGSVNLVSISARGGFGSNGGGGGNVNIVGGQGIYLASIDASGGAAPSGGGTGGSGAQVTLSSSDGSISVSSIELRGGPGKNGGPGGRLTVSAAGGGAEAGDISLEAVDASGGSGAVGSGGEGGQVGATAANNLYVGTARVSGGGATGGPGGAAGTIDLIAAAQFHGSDLSANGGNGGSESPGGIGGRGGTINVTSQQGSISLSSCECAGDVDAAGGQGSSGGLGGDVTLRAPQGSVILDDVGVRGGSGTLSNGGGGGSVTIEARQLVASTLDVRGGGGADSAAGPGGRGGDGGEIRLTSTASESVMELSGIRLRARGGSGGHGSTNGGEGGAGGDVTITAPVGVSWVSSSSINVNGGNGGDGGATGADHPGGHGGDAGTVTLDLGGQSSWSGDVSARGGDGGSVQNSGSAVGGDAGFGGVVLVSLGSVATLELTSSVSAQAGTPGATVASMGCEVECAPQRPGAVGQAGGLATFGQGELALTGPLSVTGHWINDLRLALAGGTVFVSGTLINSSNGQIVLSGEASRPVVAGTFVNGGLVRKSSAGVQTMALDENLGTVHVEAGELVLERLTVNDGVVDIAGPALPGEGAAAILSLGTPLGAGPSEQTLTNLGELRGRGRLNGNLVNSGVVAPGSSPGQLLIGGNFTQTAAGTLLMEIGGPNPGMDYDQLSVMGATVLGGSLQVLPFGATPPSSGTFNLLTGSAPTGSFASVLVPSGFSGTLTAGGTPVAASAPAPTSPPASGPPPAPTEPPVASAPPPAAPPVDPGPPAAAPPADPGPPAAPPSAQPPAASAPPPVEPVAATPPPPAAPAPAPEPALAPVAPTALAGTIDQIVAVLGEAQRGNVQAAVSEQRGVLHVGVLPPDDEGATRRNDDAIVITDTACRP